MEERSRTRSRAMSLSLDWDTLFGGDGKGKDKAEHIGFMVEERDSYTFITKSKYKGQWNSIGMAGFGTYTFDHKVEYEGQLLDSMFDGEGTLAYPMGQKIEGIWDKDVLTSFKFIFSDGLEYDDPWNYCMMPDRRFWTSIQEGLRPAGRELKTDKQPTRKIPDGCYDTGDGFFNPITKCVFSAEDHQKILRIPTNSEEKWILEHCRKAWDEPTGYRPDLYEKWVTGRSSEEYDNQDTSSSERSEEDDLYKIRYDLDYRTNIWW